MVKISSCLVQSSAWLVYSASWLVCCLASPVCSLLSVLVSDLSSGSSQDQSGSSSKDSSFISDCRRRRLLSQEGLSACSISRFQLQDTTLASESTRLISETKTLSTNSSPPLRAYPSKVTVKLTGSKLKREAILLSKVYSTSTGGKEPSSIAGRVHSLSSPSLSIQVSGSSTKLGSIGGSGIDAPLPSSEIFDSPKGFMATTVAVTEAKSAKLNGAARKIATGMVHDLPEIMF